MAGVVPEKERRPSVPGEFPLDHGSIFFKMHRADADAEFIRCRIGVDKKKLVKHALQTWQLEEPGVLMRICGTTPSSNAGMLSQHGDFLAALQGVLKASTTARAWLFSTALNFGMGAAVGTTLGRGRHHCDSPLIGFADWTVIQGAEQIIQPDKDGLPPSKGTKRVYTDCEPDANMSTVSLQANHSHLVLMGGEGDEDFVPPDKSLPAKTLLLQARTRSFNFAHMFEETAATHDADMNPRDARVPRILVVLSGDETTLEEILNYCRIGQGVIVFVTATGGLAEAVAKFVKTGLVPSDWSQFGEKFAELKKLNEEAAAKAKEARSRTVSGTFDAMTTSELFGGGDGIAARFPMFAFVMQRGDKETCSVLMDVVMRQIASTSDKIKAAVEWDDATRLAEIFAVSVPAWSTARADLLRDAAQLALSNECISCIKVLVELAAPVKDLDLLSLYDKLYDEDNPPRFSLFVGLPMPTTVRQAATQRRLSRSASSGLLLGGAGAPAEESSTPRTKEIKAGFRNKSKETPIQPKMPLVKQDSSYAKLEEVDPVLETVYQFYPREVWGHLGRVVPGLTKYWLDLIRAKHEAAAGGGGDAEDLASGGEIGPRWIDVYVWSVLLGNTEIAMTLLPACQEPMRAAVIGARIFADMAVLMPLNGLQLRESAKSQEEWAIQLLELCDNFTDARRMLITKSSQWQRTVLQLALQSGLRNFCAHHHCQSLCDEFLRGNNRTPGGGPIAILKERNSNLVKMLAFAACPIDAIWGGETLEWTGGDRSDAPPVSSFYKAPVVKSTLRLTFYLMYVLFMSYTAMETNTKVGGLSAADMTEAALAAESIGGIPTHTGGGQDKVYIVIISWVWTIAMALDEWYKYIQSPATFQADFWNTFDYTSISLTLSALTMGFFDMRLEMEVLAFSLLLIWCRIFK